MSANIDFHAELRKQLTFLRNSAEFFDRGNVVEAVRLATAIRVLVHDTRNSTSLLEHMGSKGIHLASSNLLEDDTSLAGRMFSLSGITVTVDNSSDGDPTIRATVVPHGAGKLANGARLPVDDWWNQIVYCLPGVGRYSRKDLVLAAANKDGGAHVDGVLPQMYAELIRGPASASASGKNPDGSAVFTVKICFGAHSESGTRIQNFQYFDIRQMATELLQSEDLIRLSQAGQSVISLRRDHFRLAGV